MRETRLVLVSYLIIYEGGASFLHQLQSQGHVKKQDQGGPRLLSMPNDK